MAPAFVTPLVLTSSVAARVPTGLRTARRSAVPCRSLPVRRPSAAITTRMTSDPTAATESLAPIVPILMGSASDMKYCRKIADALATLGISSDLRVASAHKVPARLMKVVEKYEADPRRKVYIAVAGRSNALSGMLDCAVAAPVISCPPPSDAFAGADIFSSLRMPSGVAPALVLEPSGAALLAAKILGVTDLSIRSRVSALQSANRDRLYIDDAESVTHSYMPRISMAREDNSTLLSTSAEIVFGDGVATNTKPISGKVRDRYEFAVTEADGSRSKLVALVTTDRQSAFDRVLAAIPFKGAVLNLTSAWWFRATEHIIPNHVVTVPHPYITVAKQCTPFPVEFVVRGYITGSTSTSLWKNYSKGVRNYCGIQFEEGLIKNEKLVRNVLTPTTKAEAGDEPIAPVDVVKRGLMTQADWDVCAEASMKLFEFGQQVAGDQGLILVDTKYEFGRAEDGSICLIDEVHTPDSSRYWLATSYERRMANGDEPENVDKEFLRLWFADNCDPYDKTKELPQAPGDLVDELSRRYIMLYELITGENFDFEGGAPEAIAQSMQSVVAKIMATSAVV